VQAAKEESVSVIPGPSPGVPSFLSENSHQGLDLPTAALHLAFPVANSNTASGFQGSVYDFCVGSRCTGKERDAETGLDYFGARYLSSAQGRWMSPDWSAAPQAVPYADLSDPQTLNLYGYVRNNPLSKNDPDGHCPPCIIEEVLESPPVQAAIEKATPYVAAGAGAALGYILSKSDAIRNGVNDFVQYAIEHPGKPAHRQDFEDMNPQMLFNEKRPGTLGKPDHQATADEEAKKMGGDREVTIKTPGGAKDSRRADAAKVVDGKVVDCCQIYRPTPAGNIPKREVDAARDIEKATGVKPRMVPVRPVKKPEDK